MSVKCCEQQRAEETVTGQNNYIKEVCVHSVEKKNTRQIGMNMEIDKSVYTKKIYIYIRQVLLQF